MASFNQTVYQYTNGKYSLGPQDGTSGSFAKTVGQAANQVATKDLKTEENTVYELDPECLRHKEEQRQLEEKRKQEKQENDNYRMQKRPEKRNQNNMWIICWLLLVICQ